MKKYTCLNCDKECDFGNSKSNKYCSNKCQGEYNFKHIILEKFNSGLIEWRETLRKCLSYTVGYYCNVCKLNDWLGKPITLVVDHKDGNAGNNLPENLQLLCPNCNAQSEFFSGANKGNGRKSRGLKR